MFISNSKFLITVPTLPLRLPPQRTHLQLLQKPRMSSSPLSFLCQGPFWRTQNLKNIRPVREVFLCVIFQYPQSRQRPWYLLCRYHQGTQLLHRGSQGKFPRKSQGTRWAQEENLLSQSQDGHSRRKVLQWLRKGSQQVSHRLQWLHERKLGKNQIF